MPLVLEGTVHVGLRKKSLKNYFIVQLDELSQKLKTMFSILDLVYSTFR